MPGWKNRISIRLNYRIHQDRFGGFMRPSLFSLLAPFLRRWRRGHLLHRILGRGRSVTFVLDVETPFPEGEQTFINSASVGSSTFDTDTSDNFATAMVTVSFGQESRSLRSSITSDIVAAPRDGATVGNLFLNGKAVATKNNASPFRYTIAGQAGKNAIEAHLLTSKEGDVLWRFDFTTAAGFVQRSFIVESGQVVSQDGRTIVFRLDGLGQEIRFRFTLSGR